MPGHTEWSRRRPASADLAVAAAGLAATVAVVGMWLPWFRSGAAERNSFGFFRAAQTLGIEWVTPFRVAWFLVPVLLPLSVALLGFRARRAGLGVLAVIGLVLGGAGGLSLLSFGSAAGSAASTIAGTCCMVLGVIALRRSSMFGRRRCRGEPVTSSGPQA